MKTKLKSPAKINLTLDILGKDDFSGYHLIQSVMQEIPWLYDEIEIEIDENSSDAITKINFIYNKLLPTTHYPLLTNNSIWQAIEIMRRETGHLENIHVKVKKNIPTESGLGGGSSNAAAVLKFLNSYWKLKKSRRFLARLASEIGMDCAFFIYGGTAIASHFGEEIEPLDELKITENDLKIIFTDIKISTKDAYQLLHRRDKKFFVSTRCHNCTELINGIKNGENFHNLKKYFHNDFEESIFQKPEFQDFFTKNNLDTKNTRLCGSGGAIFTY